MIEAFQLYKQTKPASPVAKLLHAKPSKFKYFLILRNSSASLVLDYEEVVFRSFNSGSTDMRTESVLSVVWQLAAVKDKLSKYCPSELV